MDTRLITTQLRHRSWMEEYARQQESGLTVREWCEQVGITTKTFYYRLKILRKEALSLANVEASPEACAPPTEFVKVNLPQAQAGSSGIKIKLSDAEISISPDSNAEHVRMVLEAIAHA